MIEVSIVYNDDKQIEKVKDIKKDSLTFHFIDINTKKGRREGWKLKNHWGSYQHPFVLIEENDKPVKAFYSEACNVIDSLINYLKIEYLE